MIKSTVLVGGCFDILHIGHIQFLKKAKKLGDYLVVLLESDENIKKLKGSNRPIHNFKERKLILESLKLVDHVVAVPNDADNKTYDNLVKKIKPNVIAITEDDPIKDKKLIQAKTVGAKLKIIKKFKSKSTTEIIELI